MPGVRNGAMQYEGAASIFCNGGSHGHLCLDAVAPVFGVSVASTVDAPTGLMGMTLPSVPRMLHMKGQR